MTREEMILSFLPLARSVARTYQRMSIEEEDRMSIAYLALVETVDRYPYEDIRKVSRRVIRNKICNALRNKIKTDKNSRHIRDGQKLQEEPVDLDDRLEFIRSFLNDSDYEYLILYYTSVRSVTERYGISKSLALYRVKRILDRVRRAMRRYSAARQPSPV